MYNTGMPKYTPIPTLLTPEWKQAFADNWLDEYQEPDSLDNVQMNTTHASLSQYRMGPYLIVPAMNDDQNSDAHVLAAVGFSLEKEIEIPVGSSDCKALVFIEIPDFTGPRGVLLSCNCSDVFWQMQLS